MPNFSLIGDRVAVKLEDPESTTPGGIVIPDNAKELSTKGTVVAVGPGLWSERNNRHIPMSVKVGMRVMLGKYGHTKIEVDGEEFSVCKEDDLLALLGSEVRKK